MPDLRLEKRHLAACSGAVIGIDEVGRGPWAGPVTAAAFWINPNCFDELPPELNDSKKLSPAKRASIYAALTGGEHAFCVVSIAAAEIDRIGILGATFLAMRQAATKLEALLLSRRNAAIGLCLVDGNFDPDLGMPVKTVIKGDALSCSIAADLARDHAVYGWDSNMGYGTKSHSDALHAHGISEHHRRSFAPIKRLLQS